MVTKKLILLSSRRKNYICKSHNFSPFLISLHNQIKNNIISFSVYFFLFSLRQTNKRLILFGFNTTTNLDWIQYSIQKEIIIFYLPEGKALKEMYIKYSILSYQKNIQHFVELDSVWQILSACE